jgi:hypothetical protein
MFRAEHRARRLPPFGIGAGLASIPNVPRGTLAAPFAAVSYRRSLPSSLGPGFPPGAHPERQSAPAVSPIVPNWNAMWGEQNQQKK